MDLKHTQGRVVVSVDIEGKNSHTFADGTKIRLERQYNNLNKRETQPVNAIVISAEDIPTGVEILVHHNSIHDVNKIFDYAQLSGEEIASDIKLYSIPHEECFIWKDENGKWQPLKGFATAWRVFQPYKGLLRGIESIKIHDTLYITSGEFKGNVVRTVKAADYQIVFQDSNGQEGNIIRCRHYEDEYNEREEIIALDFSSTEKIINGQLWVGITPSDAKPISQNVSVT